MNRAFTKLNHISQRVHKSEIGLFIRDKVGWTNVPMLLTTCAGGIYGASCGYKQTKDKNYLENLFYTWLFSAAGAVSGVALGFMLPLTIPAIPLTIPVFLYRAYDRKTLRLDEILNKDKSI